MAKPPIKRKGSTKGSVPKAEATEPMSQPRNWGDFDTQEVHTSERRAPFLRAGEYRAKVSSLRAFYDKSDVFTVVMVCDVLDVVNELDNSHEEGDQFTIMAQKNGYPQIYNETLKRTIGGFYQMDPNEVKSGFVGGLFEDPSDIEGREATIRAWDYTTKNGKHVVKFAFEIDEEE